MWAGQCVQLTARARFARTSTLVHCMSLHISLDAPDPQHFCPTFETLVVQNAIAHLQGAIPRFAC